MRRFRSKSEYPENWPAIAERVKAKNKWRCERCGEYHDIQKGFCLTVHHLDGDKQNNADWNLAALCQRCHLYMQPVVMDQMMFDFVEVSDWYRPHLAGYLKAKEGRGTRDEGRRTMDDERLYKYVWGNNEKRLAMKGRTCRILGSGAKNSVVIEFIDNGQREIVSRHALRKVK